MLSQSHGVEIVYFYMLYVNYVSLFAKRIEVRDKNVELPKEGRRIQRFSGRMLVKKCFYQFNFESEHIVHFVQMLHLDHTIYLIEWKK